MRGTDGRINRELGTCLHPGRHGYMKPPAEVNSPAGGPPPSSYPSHVDLANIVDAKPKHGDAFETIPSANHNVTCWIAAKVLDNPVCIDTPGENLRPPAVVFYFKLPSLRAHGVLGRNDFYDASRKEHIHGLKHLAGYVPGVKTLAIVEPKKFSLVEGAGARLVLTGKETGLHLSQRATVVQSAANAALSGPLGVAVDAAGNLYIAASGNLESTPMASAISLQRIGNCDVSLRFQVQTAFQVFSQQP
jgi:hypothetical protein